MLLCVRETHWDFCAFCGRVKHVFVLCWDILPYIRMQITWYNISYTKLIIPGEVAMCALGLLQWILL